MGMTDFSAVRIKITSTIALSPKVQLMHIYLKMSYYVLKLSLTHIPAVSISFQVSYMEEKRKGKG